MNNLLNYKILLDILTNFMAYIIKYLKGSKCYSIIRKVFFFQIQELVKWKKFQQNELILATD